MKFSRNLHLTLISDFVILSDSKLKIGVMMVTNITLLKRMEIKLLMVNTAVILKLG